MTLGSLFDGSGGFPLAGTMNDITPIWASEIEPYPLKVTAARFPDMKQLGDVTQINGAEIEPVDVITFGSPCQDLSLAGKRAGIHDGARSSLFFEAIRIIKEMRDATDDQYPRFAVWENVPGAFTSNKGDDFWAVLQSFVEVCDPITAVPRPEKWGGSGCLVGDGYSVAWRVYDAQFWGVPQRRKRIYLVADFGSERAGEILFESEGLSGDSTPSGAPWQRASGASKGSSDAYFRLRSFGDYIDEVKSSSSLKARDYKDATDLIVRAIENHPADSRVTLQNEGEPIQTLTSRMGTGGATCQWSCT